MTPNELIDALPFKMRSLGAPLPDAARRIAVGLRQASRHDIEALADAFLTASVPTERAGEALYVAAALQVYFTRLAASLPAQALRLLPGPGLCPCCGSTPVAGVVTASGRTPGTRYLTCSLCATAWNHVRAVCITCGESRAVSLKAIEGGDDVARPIHATVARPIRRRSTKPRTWGQLFHRRSLDAGVGCSAGGGWLGASCP